MHHDEDAHIESFQRRFDNGYYIYDDPLYLDWLRQEHPDSLPAPEHLIQHVDEQLDLSVSELPVNQEAATDVIDISVASGSSLEGSSTSLSSSLSSTRELISELKALVIPKVNVNSKGKEKLEC